MRFLSERVVFELPGLSKTSSDITSVFFAKFEDCIFMKSCIARTDRFLSQADPNWERQLLNNYHRSHNPVKSIARWIKCTLGCASIDTSVFQALSTRSALTSNDRESGFSLEEVLKMDDWSGPSSFVRFYNRPPFLDDFSKAVLYQG